MVASSHSSKGTIIGLISIAVIFVLLALGLQSAYHRDSPVDKLSARESSFGDIELYLAENRVRDTAANIERSQTDIATRKERREFAHDLTIVSPEMRASFEALCSKPPLVSGNNGFCSVANGTTE